MHLHFEITIGSRALDERALELDQRDHELKRGVVQSFITLAQEWIRTSSARDADPPRAEGVGAPRVPRPSVGDDPTPYAACMAMADWISRVAHSLDVAGKKDAAQSASAIGSYIETLAAKLAPT